MPHPIQDRKWRGDGWEREEWYGQEMRRAGRRMKREGGDRKEEVSKGAWRKGEGGKLKGNQGLRTHRTRDTSAPVHEAISALRLSGPNGETVRTVGPDTSVLGPGHFRTSAAVSSYCAYGRTSPRQCIH